MTLTDKINEQIAAGRTVQIATPLRVTRVTPKVVAEWKEDGYDFFIRDADGSDRMISRTSKGKPVYDIINGTRITVLAA